MHNGQRTSTGLYKIDGKYSAVSQSVGESAYAYYSSELSGWVTGSPSSAGLSRDILDGETFYSDSALQTALGTVSDATFVSIAMSVSRSRGTLAISSGTMYGGYGVLNGSYTVRLSGYDASSLYPSSIRAQVGGSAIASVSWSNEMTFVATGDVTILANVKYKSFSVGSISATNGSVTLEKMDQATGSWTPVATGGTFASGVPIRATVSVNTGYSFVSISAVNGVSMQKSVTVLDGSKAVFSIGDSDDPETNVISFVLSTSVKTPYTNTVAFDSQKGSVTVNATACTGTFVGYSGDQYNIQATPSSGYKVSEIRRNGSSVSSSGSYSFVHGNAASSFEIIFSEEVYDEPVSVATYSGDSSDAYGSDTEAYGAGCRLNTVTHPQAVGQKYKKGIWRFSLTFPSVPEGGSQEWFFMALYIVETNGEYREKIVGTETIEGVEYVNAYVGVDSRVVAVFYRKQSEPADVDQGRTSTAVSGTGLYWWERGNAVMNARWKGRRNVFVQPIMFSAVQVYADGYTTNPVVKIHQFQSPNETDAAVATTTVSITSQDTRRVPVRRREKYVELEVDAKSTISQVSISTSMGGVWRPNT